MEKINRIVHISDIHLRNFKRHEEYRRVFHKLYKYIGDTHTPDTLILLTGDIVHSKTDVTPELYEEVQLFLKTLCQFGPTLMIPGNHDANLNNSDRLDALTPVVNAINEKNLIYLKETEIRTIGGVDFYHWSVFDNVINYPKPKDTNRKKICLYHGLVNNSVNDFGYVMKSETIKTSMFDGFDMVMLGDIHTHQSLNPSGTIKYPGSLIQQNHGEGLVHGILVWDIKTNSSEFVEIDNDTAFYTVDIDNGVYSVDYTQLPQNIYLRVRHKTTSQEDLKKCIREIKSNRNVVETTVAKISDFDAKNKQQLHGKGIDFRNPNSQNEYIRLYLKTVHRATEEDILAVCELNNSINSKLTNTETPRNTIWSPKRFEFENMFGYKKNNYIDFSNMEGTYGIFAPNASGKSTLLDAVTYCLFDKCSKTSRAQEVMNNQSESFKCKFSFELNDRIYFIERSARKLKQGNVRVDVNFYYLDDLGNDVSLNGKDRSDTNSNIRKILG
jgi:DNA repair exonuclease SbcCD nuclease subunit